MLWEGVTVPSQSVNPVILLVDKASKMDELSS
jgi:hypothetical protein